MCPAILTTSSIRKEDLVFLAIFLQIRHQKNGQKKKGNSQICFFLSGKFAVRNTFFQIQNMFFFAKKNKKQGILGGVKGSGLQLSGASHDAIKNVYPDAKMLETDMDSLLYHIYDNNIY